MDTVSDPQNPRFPKELFTTCLLIVLVWGLWMGQAFFIPLSLAALLAFLMAPAVRIMTAYRVPEFLAIGIAVLLLLLPFSGILYLVAGQTQALLQDYPSIAASAQREIIKLTESRFGREWHLSEQFSASMLTEKLSSGAGEGLRLLIHSLRTIFEAGTELVLIFLFAIIMLASREHLARSGQRILAQFESIEAGRMLDAVTTLIEQFLITKMIVIGIVTVMTFGALELMGLRYAFLLAAMTGVLTLLPEVGFVLGLIPVLAVALATGHSFSSNVFIFSGLIVIHLIEANWITPRLVGRSLNLNVLSTFIALFAGSLLWGVWGMFLSVPILGVMRIVFSAAPSLQPWAQLLSEREDRQMSFQLMSEPFRARMKKALIDKMKQKEKNLFK